MKAKSWHEGSLDGAVLISLVYKFASLRCRILKHNVNETTIST